jgi:hypothetical protein
MSLINLNDAQAQYLNSLSYASKDYRRACAAVAEAAQEDIESMNAGKKPYGQSHQRMQEMVAGYGAVKALLDVVWSVFRVDNFTGQMQTDARDEINELLRSAMAECTDKHSIGGHKFFLATKEMDVQTA